jgi:hypothetical protein
MKAATRRDAAAWFSAPPTVTTATICRLSGKLAGEGCKDAVYQNEKGELVRGSLEYTEYFVAGTEPTEYCPIHSPGEHVLASDPGSHMPGAIHPPQPTHDAPPEGQKKKKGFWGRIFGR